TGSPAAIVIIAAALIVSVTVSVIYAVAFAQGRSVSFWPPSIGERPKPPTGDQAGTESRASAIVPAGDASSPIVDRGTVLQAASGKTYRILSPFYGGANATLYKAEETNGNAAVIAKMYWRGLAPNSPPWELFQQEQRTAEILTHRNIVRT